MIEDLNMMCVDHEHMTALQISVNVSRTNDSMEALIIVSLLQNLTILIEAYFLRLTTFSFWSFDL